MCWLQGMTKIYYPSQGQVSPPVHCWDTEMVIHSMLTLVTVLYLDYYLKLRCTVEKKGCENIPMNAEEPGIWKVMLQQIYNMF